LKLKGKVAIVTGAGRGIGEATALAFARQGARLVIASRTETELVQVSRTIAQMGGEVVVKVANVTDSVDVHNLVAAAMNSYGAVDILVNAAGVYGPIGPMWEVSPEKWLQAFQINLYGTFLCCRAVLAHMVEKRSGSIINYSGGGATAPLARFSAYGASKAAVVRLTETLAEEVKQYDIRVNAIAPGAVDTKLQDEVLAAGERAGRLLAQIRELRETGKGGVPRELPAELAVFLASKESLPLTGKLISAPHDGWQTWDPARIEEVASLPWFTLRRMDPFTLKPLMQNLENTPER